MISRARTIRHTVSLLTLLLVGVVGLTVPACATNPYTERSQLLLIPESEELALGQQAYRQILEDPKVTVATDPRLVEPVQRIARRIIEAAKTSKYAKRTRLFDWKVTVIQDDQTRNAFALPGGKIAVYTGIFPVAKNEDGLAAIMGHEVVHALARHGAERMSQVLLAQLGLTAAQVALSSGGGSPVLTDTAMATLGLGAQVGILLPFSRSHESEADYIGLLLAAKAGYDPREAIRVWERMSEATKGQPPEFLSTHPSHGTRITQLQQWMPEALLSFQNAPRAPSAALPPIGQP